MGAISKLNEYSNKTKIDNMTLIWLDKSISRTDDNYYSMYKLCYLIENIRTFNRIDTFIQYLSNELTEEIILIVSGSFGSQIISEIHNFPLIDSIYIFCQNKTKHRSWAKDFNKVQGVFNDIDLICLHLRKEKLFQEHFIKNNSSVDKQSNSFKFIEHLNEPDYQSEQDKIDFLFDCTENEALPVLDIIDQNLNEYKNENLDRYLMYFSSNDIIERVDLNDCVEQSNTVIPFIQQTNQKYFDNGVWPCLLWIIKNENDLSKMVSFNKIRHLIFNTRIIENIEIYSKSLKNHLNEEHFLVICDEDNLEEYLPIICYNENIRRIYLHSLFNNFEKYKKIIKNFSKIISMLQYSDTLIHMILHDFVFYLIKLGEHYRKENKNNFAKIRYEYALRLQSNIRFFIEERIGLINEH